MASKTPHNYPHTPGTIYGAQSINTPYTPSGQTPFMTPFHTGHTPHHSASQTPRSNYGQTTPNSVFAHPRPPTNARPRTNPHHGQHSSAPNAHGKPSPRSNYRSPHVPTRNRYNPAPHSHNSRPHHSSSYQSSSHHSATQSNQSYHSKSTANDDNWDNDWDAPPKKYV